MASMNIANVEWFMSIEMARDGLLGYTVIRSGVLSPVSSRFLCCPTYGQMSTR
jgi:hypothetical protein